MACPRPTTPESFHDDNNEPTGGEDSNDDDNSMEHSNEDDTISGVPIKCIPVYLFVVILISCIVFILLALVCGSSYPEQIKSVIKCLLHVPSSLFNMICQQSTEGKTP